jgi:hypothetical protein
LQVVEEYKGHASIAYGADWYRGTWGASSQATQPATSHALHESNNSSRGLEDMQPAATAGVGAAAAAAAAEAIAGLQLGEQQQQQRQQQEEGEMQERRHVQQQQEEGMAAGFSRDVVATCSFYDRRVHLWSPGYTCKGFSG